MLLSSKIYLEIRNYNDIQIYSVIRNILYVMHHKSRFIIEQVPRLFPFLRKRPFLFRTLSFFL